MTKSSTLHRTLVRFWVPLLLALIFYFANSAATDAFPGKEVNTAGNGNLAKTGLENHDEQEKLKKLLPPKPSVKKPFPIPKKPSSPQAIPAVEFIPKLPPIHFPPFPVPRPMIPKKLPHLHPHAPKPPPPSFPKIP